MGEHPSRSRERQAAHHCNCMAAISPPDEYGSAEYEVGISVDDRLQLRRGLSIRVQATLAIGMCDRTSSLACLGFVCPSAQWVMKTV